MDYQRLYNAIISKRKTFPLSKTDPVYTELHHITPRCLGGDDSKGNLVRLTAREHFIIHRILSKLYPDSQGLALTVLFMSKVQGGRIVSSREFSRLKEIAALGASNRFNELWERKEFKEFMSSLRKERNKRLWADTEFRKYMSERMVEKWKDGGHSANFINGKRKFLETNPWPWQRKVSTKEIWTLAASFWELSKYNEENTGKKYGYSQFCKEFCRGRNQRIFQNMLGMFKTGWEPLKCDKWLEEFGHKM